MAARWGPLSSGAGDDAAIMDVPAGMRLVASTDSSIEGVHFRRDWLTLEEIGYRATTAALSDLAAMAASPLGLLVAAAIPTDIARRVEALADGIGLASRVAGCPIVGGDLTRDDRISLTITVLGMAASPVRRVGARPGDGLYVTGELGGPGAAVRALAASQVPDPGHLDRFCHPVARLAESAWLAAAGATAMIDISDGLSSDARHLAAASGVSIAIDVDALPVIPGAGRVEAASSGEEYELLATAPDELDCRAFRQAFGIPLTRIGTVSAREDVPVTFRQGNQRVDLAGGYDHFSS